MSHNQLFFQPPLTHLSHKLPTIWPQWHYVITPVVIACWTRRHSRSRLSIHILSSPAFTRLFHALPTISCCYAMPLSDFCWCLFHVPCHAVDVPTGQQNLAQQKNTQHRRKRREATHSPDDQCSPSCCPNFSCAFRLFILIIPNCAM